MGPLTPTSSMSMSRADLEQGFTPTSSSGGQMQIFNIEAYCKLCNKEFCNKYFLKTHMANKHGVYSDPASSSASSGPRFEGGALGSSSPSGNRFPASNIPVSISGSFMAMSSSKDKSFPAPRESPKEGSDGSRPQSHAEMRSPLPSPIRPHSTGAPATPTSSQSPKSGPPPLIPGRPSSGSMEADRPEMTAEDLKRMDMELKRQGIDMSALPAGIRLPMVPSLGGPFGGGPMNFDSLMKFNPLEGLKKDSASDLEAEFDKNKRTIPNVPSLPGKSSEGQKGNMTPDRLRQMGVINADAFCEYCCKEFCNKYFLRVHKLKKHGVCSPELPPEKVQKILQQMAKEAGKTGQPMPPLTMGAPSAIRPPGSSTLSDPPRSMSSALGPMGGPFGSMPGLGSLGSSPLNLIRPPHLPNFLNLPPLDNINSSNTKDDSQSSCSSDRPDEREEGRPINFSASSPRSIIEPECELKIDENAPVIKSPGVKDPEDQLESSDEMEQKSPRERPSENGVERESETSEGLANLQNMIMKLNNSKSAQSKVSSQDSTICKVCNKDMENKYFLHAHMMNEHGMLHVEDDRAKSPPGLPVSLPQYPADLSKSVGSAGLTIPNPLMSRQGSLHSLANGFPKLSDKPMNIFEQMQGLPRPSFLEQMKKDLGSSVGGSLDIPLSPMKRPSLERDPNKKPASLSRSYCEICKKELCNKYFMKTHMMKMHGIMMEDGPPKGSVPCDICKKELSSRYFLKVHMAQEHGMNEDGTPLPPHMRDNGLMNMFPPLGDFPAPPPLGEFSRLLMQQGEKNMERQKELERQRQRSESGNGGGHVCSLCSNTFPDIIALQVHIIKSHGALPPTTGLDSLMLGKMDNNKTDNANDDEVEEVREKGDDTGEEEEKEEEKEEDKSSSAPMNPMLPFLFGGGMPGQDNEASKNLQELLQRQMMMPGMMNPFQGLGSAPAGNQQFQGLFNMFLSEMLKKVQKDTPPQTPPSSPPPPQETDSCTEETQS